MQAALAVIALTGCAVHHRVTVQGKAIRQAIPELRSHGAATVDARDERSDGRRDERRESLSIDQMVIVDGESRRVRDLIDGCTVDGSEPCPLAQLGYYPIDIRRYRTRNVGKVIGGITVVAVAGAFGTAVGCGIACEDGSTARRASVVTAVVVGGGVVAVVGWLLLSCTLGRSGCFK